MLICTLIISSRSIVNAILLFLMLTLNILQIVPATSIPDDWMGLDVGPDATKTFNEALDTTQTVIWNGPMGVFEFEKFAAGTEVTVYISFHPLTVVSVLVCFGI
jgi:3-phosphoglycerate kinase